MGEYMSVFVDSGAFYSCGGGGGWVVGHLQLASTGGVAGGGALAALQVAVHLHWRRRRSKVAGHWLCRVSQVAGPLHRRTDGAAGGGALAVLQMARPWLSQKWRGISQMCCQFG